MGLKQPVLHEADPLPPKFNLAGTPSSASRGDGTGTGLYGLFGVLVIQVAHTLV